MKKFNLRSRAVLITILFAYSVSVVSISYSFYAFYKLNRAQHIQNIFTKHNLITQNFLDYFQNRMSMALLEANLAVNNLYRVRDKKEVNAILQSATLLAKDEVNVVNTDLFFQTNLFKTHNLMQKLYANMLESSGHIYFYINTNNNAVLLEDRVLKPYKYWSLLSVYLSIILFVSVSFILIIVRLRPLQRLHKKIRLFAKGDMNVSFKMYGEDEIALIANELDNARVQLRDMIQARSLFLRNIMHELKTPITKGRILTQMIDNEKQQQRFNTIFVRLEDLINEFALMEEVSSGFGHLEIQEYRYIDIVDGAIDMAFVEPESVTFEGDSTKKVNVDYRLFTTAIKNMIDNAMKYSSDAHIVIGTSADELYFESNGKKLEHPLSYYVQAFTKEHNAKNSFGLGLYLVDAILKVHNYVLAYEYRDGVNRFIFVPMQ